MSPLQAKRKKGLDLLSLVLRRGDQSRLPDEIQGQAVYRPLLQSPVQRQTGHAVYVLLPVVQAQDQAALEDRDDRSSLQPLPVARTARFLELLPMVRKNTRKKNCIIKQVQPM